MVENISKAEIAELPVEVFDGEISIIQTEKEVEEAMERLKKVTFIGFDTETRPAFAKGKSYKISLVQLATEHETFLFRLNKIDFPHSLVELLSNPNVNKIGLSLKDDFSAIRKRVPDFIPGGFVELQTVAKNAGLKEAGLQRIYAILFDKKISKSQRLSNWDAEELSNAQKMYASIDAWACLKIYNKLSSLLKNSK